MRDRKNPVRHPVHNSGGEYMFNSHQTNQQQSGWGVGQVHGQVQHVAMQQQHFALLQQQQQQQQQQQRPQYQQHQTQWGNVITSGTTIPLIGQQQHQQQQLQQQLQPWGGQYAQSQSQQQQQLPPQVAQFNPSAIQPQHHIVQVQSNHQSPPLGQQHTLQSIHPTNPSQPHLTPQSWTPHPPTARGQPLVGCANGALPLPWGQQPRGRGIPSVAKRPAGSSSSPKTGSISSYSSSFNGTGTLGKSVASGHRNSFSLSTPPSPSRHDGVSNKRARKRKSRATGTPSSENWEGKGMSASFDESNSRDHGGGSRVQPCEPCEKEFNSESARKAHLESHVTCKEDGCEFSALAKVVNYHHEIKHGQFSGSGFQMIDVEGQKFRVLLGTCPEEVEQWRASRRKLWPTTANIARKNEHIKKRKQLGDLGPDTGVAGRGRGRGRGRGGPPILKLSSTDDPQKKVENVVGGLEKGAPAKTEQLGEGGVSGTGSGVGGLEAGDGPRKVKKRLCSFYLRGKCTKGDACTFSHDVERRLCGYFMKGKCFRGKACTFIHDTEARAKAKRESRDAVDSGSEKPDKKRAAKRLKAERDAMRQVESKPTLLRNLLAPQLHRESSIALQAVRFIVESNFFLDPVHAKADGETSKFSPSEAATAAVDTIDTCDGVSASNDRMPSESQNPVEDDDPHSMGVTESAVAVVTPMIGVGEDVDPETAISHAALLATGNRNRGLSPEDQNGDAAGSVHSRVREDQTECVESDAAVAECAKDSCDSAAATDAVTNGVLPGDQCGDLTGNVQSRVEEDRLQTAKEEPGRIAMVSGVDHLEGADVSTEGGTAVVSTVASGTKVDRVFPGHQVSDPAAIDESLIEDKNTQLTVGNESVVSSVVSSMASGDMPEPHAVSTSTDGVLPEEKRSDAIYNSPTRHAEDEKPQQTVGEESLVPKARAPSAGSANQGAVVAETDGLPQGTDGDVDADCGSQNRVEQENKAVEIPSPATAGSCDDAAAPATSDIDMPSLT